MSDWRKPTEEDLGPQDSLYEFENIKASEPSNSNQSKEKSTITSTDFLSRYLTIFLLAFILIQVFLINARASRIQQKLSSLILNNQDQSLNLSQNTNSSPILLALEQALKDSNFKAADNLTRAYFFTINETTEKTTDRASFQNMSCKDITQVDELWKKYSDNKFGISNQIKIWENSNDANSLVTDFGKQVGWYSESQDRWLSMDELNFTLKAPPGHLPTSSPVSGGVNTETNRNWLFGSFLNVSITSECFSENQT